MRLTGECLTTHSCDLITGPATPVAAQNAHRIRRVDMKNEGATQQQPSGEIKCKLFVVNFIVCDTETETKCMQSGNRCKARKVSTLLFKLWTELIFFCQRNIAQRLCSVAREPLHPAMKLPAIRLCFLLVFYWNISFSEFSKGGARHRVGIYQIGVINLNIRLHHVLLQWITVFIIAFCIFNIYEQLCIQFQHEPFASLRSKLLDSFPIYFIYFIEQIRPSIVYCLLNFHRVHGISALWWWMIARTDEDGRPLRLLERNKFFHLPNPWRIQFWFYNFQATEFFTTMNFGYYYFSILVNIKNDDFATHSQGTYLRNNSRFVRQY